VADIEFVDGLIVKAPHERAPDFVKASISIKVADLGQWLRERYKNGEEWVNCDVKVAKSGTWYACVNTYKPKERNEEARTAGSTYRPGKAKPQDDNSDIPF
jgi:hypothetical protein